MKKKILIIRFSALGDVALLAPVVAGICKENTHMDFYMLTRPKFKPLFMPMDNLIMLEADVDDQYKGFFGLVMLSVTLFKYRFHAVVDVHDHLRSRYLSTILRFTGCKIYRFDKGSKEKKQMTAPPPKKIFPLPHTTERYKKAFEPLGITLPETIKPLARVGKVTDRVIQLMIRLKSQPVKIGIAPFAAHASKEWPFERIVETMHELLDMANPVFLLFGGGEREINRLKDLQQIFPDSVLIAGQYTLTEELEIMKQLSVILCMDSGNMHLAALVGAKVVSIWGPTHPYLGFSPIHNEKGIIQTQQKCRPSSIYGRVNPGWQELCAQDSLNAIETSEVTNKILEFIREH